MFNKIKMILQSRPWLVPVVGIIVIAFFIALSLGRKALPVPSVIAIEPPVSVPVGIYPVFKITFDRAPTKEQQSHFSASIVPNAALSAAWQDNILSIIPTSGLNPGSQYTLSIIYNQKTLTSLPYTTIALSNLSPEDQTRMQTQADYNFAQEQDALYKQKPWLNLLPITTSEYTVVYDFDLQKLRIRLKTPYTDAQKAELLQSLSQKGIPTGAIYWIQQ